jgi:HAMP domain-containing protein
VSVTALATRNALAILLTIPGVALVNLVPRSLLKPATNQIDSGIEQTQQRLATANVSSKRVISLPTVGDVVVQVINYKDTRVLAASSAIASAPVLARPITDAALPSGLTFSFIRNPGTQAILPELSSGEVSTITTTQGPALVFGFVYGGAIEHSVRVLLVSLLISFPLLLLMSGALIWLGIGLALAPVESIRRRVDAIAAEDLTERVPVTGGDDEIARMARTVNAMLDRLESASKFQQEFVSNASHELRSPLTTLLATGRGRHHARRPPS